MKFVLLGPPGSGKGTQAKKLAKKFEIAHISSGDILRSEVSRDTALGKQVKQYMDRGEIGPQELITEVILNYISGNCPFGFVLDGFPRTRYQAKKLEEKFDIVAAILLDVPEDEIIKRITGRRTCRDCGRIYHVDYNPPENDGKCDACGGELFLRSDDTEETVRNRMKVYYEETMPVIEFFEKKKVLHRVVGTGEQEKIFGEILHIV